LSGVQLQPTLQFIDVQLLLSVADIHQLELLISVALIHIELLLSVALLQLLFSVDLLQLEFLISNALLNQLDLLISVVLKHKLFLALLKLQLQPSKVQLLPRLLVSASIHHHSQVNQFEKLW
jgi:hypothetical protein